MSRVDELLASPVGCAFVLTVANHNIPVSDALAIPKVFQIAGHAVCELTPWVDDPNSVAAAACELASHHRALASDLLDHPSAAWWFESIDRSAQMWLGSETPDFSTKTGPLERWERYAQKPTGHRLTSTMQRGTSSLQVGIQNVVMDLIYEFPVHRLLYEVRPEARVFEVASAVEWHDLCRIYPAEDDGTNHPFGPGIVPDWSAVGRDFDGVHLGLGGLLTASRVRIESEAGVSHLWAHETEWTIWLRNVLSPMGVLSDLEGDVEREALDAGIDSYKTLRPVVRYDRSRRPLRRSWNRRLFRRHRRN